MSARTQNPEASTTDRKDRTSPAIITAAVIRGLKDASIPPSERARILDPGVPQAQLPDEPVVRAARRHLVRHNVI